MKRVKELIINTLAVLLLVVPTATAGVGGNDPLPVPQRVEPLKPAPLPSYFGAGERVVLNADMMPAVFNLAELIVGRVPGVYITGSPYTGYRIRIRGALAPPLLVVDNMPFYGLDDERLNDLLRMIPAADVAAIEVLKSAAQGAIYGANGANGVIRIITMPAVMKEE